jgi:hypothetical protein
LAGNTDATKGFGSNSTASAAEYEFPGTSKVMVSVIVMVLVFGTGFTAGLAAAATFGPDEQIDSAQRSTASADLGMDAI